jgi:glycosyltransferase involved in cell wall biosynthesis
MAFDVLFLSRFNAFCGVSTYTEQLATALALKRIDVGALSSNSCVRDENQVVPCIVGWAEDGKLEEVLDGILSREPKVVHIQHEHGIFRSPRALLALCREIHRATDTKVVMTAHTVPKHPLRQDDDFLRLLREVDGLIVHSRMSQQVISSYPKPFDTGKVKVIPHGMLPPVPPAPREEAERALGLKSRKNVFRLLSLGFISNEKRHMAILQLVKEMAGMDLVAPKKLELIIAGKQPQPAQNIVGLLKKTAKSYGLGRSVFVFDKFVPFDRLPYYYGAADLGIHMVTSSHHSASGSIRTDLSHGLPVIASRSPMTAGLSGGVVQVGSTDELLVRLQRLAKSPGELKKLADGATRFARRNSWGSIALRHIRLYEDLCGKIMLDRRDGVRSALFHTSPWLLGSG